jgi:hypothetical protein
MSMDLVIPGTGEIVSAEDAAGCARALSAVRNLERELRDAKAALTDAIVQHATVHGVKTLHLDGGIKAEIRGGTETVYDAEAIEADLRAAGAPEDMIREIVVEQIAYTVDARRATQASRANPAYRDIIERHRSTRDKPTYVTLRTQR